MYDLLGKVQCCSPLSKGSTGCRLIICHKRQQYDTTLRKLVAVLDRDGENVASGIRHQLNILLLVATVTVTVPQQFNWRPYVHHFVRSVIKQMLTATPSLLCKCPVWSIICRYSFFNSCFCHCYFAICPPKIVLLLSV